MIDRLNTIVDSIVQFMGGRDSATSIARENHDGHYVFDQKADALAREALSSAGVGILSEESGLQQPDSDIWVIVDPIDGSRNCATGLPFYGPSLCAVDRDGPFAAVVHNVANGARFTATRGGGSYLNGHRISVSGTTDLSNALVCSSIEVPMDREGLRNLGAAAHELCLVANGTFDAFVADPAVQRSWDIAAGVLLVEEAGGVVFCSTPLVSGNLDLAGTVGIVASASQHIADRLLAVLGLRLVEPDRSVSSKDPGKSGRSSRHLLLIPG